MLSAIKSRCADLTLCFISFDDPRSAEEERRGLPGRVRTLQLSLATYATDWFGMNVTKASSLGSARGDVL